MAASKATRGSVALYVEMSKGSTRSNLQKPASFASHSASVIIICEHDTTEDTLCYTLSYEWIRLERMAGARVRSTAHFERRRRRTVRSNEVEKAVLRGLLVLGLFKHTQHLRRRVSF